MLHAYVVGSGCSCQGTDHLAVRPLGPRARRGLESLADKLEPRIVIRPASLSLTLALGPTYTELTDNPTMDVLQE